MSVKERPILMCGEMVRATLDGRKTQTRRIVKPQPVFTAASGDSYEWHGGHKLELAGYGADYVHSNWESVERAMLKICPQGQPGDRLWVKETWRTLERPKDGVDGILFRADEVFRAIENNKEAADLWVNSHDNGRHNNRWRPSIFMPRWASRITLEIVSVRVERVREISEDDCIAEGIEYTGDRIQDGKKTCGSVSVQGCYRTLWDSLNAKTHPWASNPFVWVVEFKKL